MKKHLLVLSVSALNFSSGMGQVLFQKTFADQSNIVLANILQTFNGEYATTCGLNRHILLLTDSLGDTLWTRNYYIYSSPSTYIPKMSQALDSGFILYGTVNYNGFGTGYLLKTNQNGNAEWMNYFEGTGVSYNSSLSYVLQTLDKRYAATGRIINNISGIDGFYIVKMDSFGVKVWSRIIRTDFSAYSSSIIQTSDSGFIVAGIEQDSASGTANKNIYLIKMDTAGDTLWTRSYGGSNTEDAKSVIEMQDGYIICGSTQSFGAGNKDIYIIKVNKQGNVMWSKTYGGSGYDDANSICQTNDSGFVITGSTLSFGSGLLDVYLLKIDSLGAPVWAKTIGGAGTDRGNDVQQTSDGGYIIGGQTASFGSGTRGYLIKTDSLGHTGCNEEDHLPTITIPATIEANPPGYFFAGDTIVSSFPTLDSTGLVVNSLCILSVIEKNNYESLVPNPNPSSNHFTFAYSFSKPFHSAQLKLHNMQGMQVGSSELQERQGTKQIEVANLANGVYFYSVLIDGMITDAKGKVVVMH